MLVPKKNRRAVYSFLFKEGVIVAKKDFLIKHPNLEVPNLQVVKLMQSLKSRGHVKENFNWQYYYFTLTSQGIDYLREYLHLPADVLPDTMKKQTKPQTRPSFRPDGDRERRPRGDRGDREAYRGPKKTGAPAEFNPEFSGEASGDNAEAGAGRGSFRGRGRGRGGFFRGRGGDFGSFRGRGGDDSGSFRGRGDDSGSYRGRGGDDSGSFRGRGDDSGSYRGRGGSYRGRGGFRGRGGASAPAFSAEQ